MEFRRQGAGQRQGLRLGSAPGRGSQLDLVPPVSQWAELTPGLAYHVLSDPLLGTSLMAKTPSSQGTGPRFDPDWGLDPMCCNYGASGSPGRQGKPDDAAVHGLLPACCLRSLPVPKPLSCSTTSPWILSWSPCRESCQTGAFEHISLSGSYMNCSFLPRPLGSSAQFSHYICLLPSCLFCQQEVSPVHCLLMNCVLITVDLTPAPERKRKGMPVAPGCPSRAGWRGWSRRRRGCGYSVGKRQKGKKTRSTNNVKHRELT